MEVLIIARLDRIENTDNNATNASADGIADRVVADGSVVIDI